MDLLPLAHVAHFRPLQRVFGTFVANGLFMMEFSTMIVNGAPATAPQRAVRTAPVDCVPCGEFLPALSVLFCASLGRRTAPYPCTSVHFTVPLLRGVLFVCFLRECVSV